MAIVLKHVIFIFMLFYTLYTSSAQNNDEGARAISISLSNYKPKSKNSQVFGNIYDINNAQNIISVTDVPIKYIDFFVIQVHSLTQNTSLSYDKNYVVGSYIKGTNIGLVQLINSATSYNFYLKINNIVNASSIYVVVVPYKQAPIPGGCNMEFMTEYAPYQILTHTDSIITVDAAPASFKNHRCESQIVKHELYQLYLNTNNFSQEAFFEGLKSMLTVENITMYGTKVSNPLTGILRQLYNLYRGTGSVYAVVATVNGSSAAYVPIVSYGCDVNKPESCDYHTFDEMLFFGTILTFLSCVLIFSGHIYYKTEMFLVGTLFGGYATFILLPLFEEINERALVWCTIGGGLLFGLLWLYLWFRFGIPIVSTMLPLFFLGYLIASVSFYAGLNDLTIFNNDITFWGFFFTIVLLSITILMGFLVHANILACAVLGSFIFIIPFDYYFHGNLKYIFINIYRHISVPNYRFAVINAPFQHRDLFLVVIWLVMTVAGALMQYKQQKGRSPFPPSLAEPPSERTPLLIPTSNRSNVIQRSF